MSNINYRNQPIVTINQSPSLVSKLETVTLQASFDLYQIEVGPDSYNIDYEWIYTDDGSTFISCGVSNDDLTIDLTSDNLERIYKLKITIQNINHTIQTNNTGTGSIGTTNNILIITNQSSSLEISDDTTSKVLYSSNYKLNHSLKQTELVKNLDISQVIKSLSQQDPTIVTAGDGFISQQNNQEIITIDTNQTEQYYESGQAIQSLEEEQMRSMGWPWSPNPNCTFSNFNAVGGCGIAVKVKEWIDVAGGCASVATGPCDIIKGAGEVTINKALGILNNCKITLNGQESYKYCDTCQVVPSQPAGVSSITMEDCGVLPNNLTGIGCGNFEPDILCPDPSIDTSVKVSSAPLKYCALGLTASVITGIIATIGLGVLAASPIGQGGAWALSFTGAAGAAYGGVIAGILANYGIQFGYLKPWIGDSCYGPGLCANGTGFVTGVSSNGYFMYQCNPESWKKPAHVSCMAGDNTYAGCDDNDVGAELFVPSCYVTYSGEGISASTSIVTNPGSNGNNVYLLKIEGTYPVPESSMPKKGCKTITLYKGSEPSDCAEAGASLPSSISVTVCANTGKDAVDVLDGISFGQDAWGVCVNPDPCLVGVGNLLCYSGDDHYILVGGNTGPGNTCQSQCSKIGGYTAPGYKALPSINRPSGPGTGKTPAELQSDAEKANQGKAFWWAVDELIPNPGSSCTMPSKQDPSGFKTATGPVGSALYISEGTPGLVGDFCKECGCKKNRECGGGCNECVNDDCITRNSALHSCYDHLTEETKPCCAYLDTTDPDSNKHDYVITCADPENCIVCIDAQLFNDKHIGTVAHLDNVNPDGSTDPDKKCCPRPLPLAGKIYSEKHPHCKTCCEGKIYNTNQCDYHCVDDVWVKKVCPDGSDYRYTAVPGSCTPKCTCITCELCEREIQEVDSDGNAITLCPHYNTTIDAQSSCTECEVITDANGEESERIYSTLKTGQTCCQTGAEDWTPAYYCCEHSNGYNHPCGKTQGCCGDQCAPNDPSKCCVGNSQVGYQIRTRDWCEDCDGNNVCRFSTNPDCCIVGETVTRPSYSWDEPPRIVSENYSETCIDTMGQCAECYSYSYTRLVSPIGTLEETVYVTEVRLITGLDPDRPGYDPCLECDGNGGTRNKCDPDDCCGGTCYDDPCLECVTDANGDDILQDKCSDGCCGGDCYDTSDPCLECNNDSLDTITSQDPTDPCYSAAVPQSIFYQP